MSVTARQLVGREEELGAIVRLLDDREDLSGALVLSGEAGIGKTAVWLAGIDAAAARGYRILSSRPSEAETKFSFAGLTDLLATAADAVLPELPPIQQRALDAALLLGEAAEELSREAVAVAYIRTTFLPRRRDVLPSLQGEHGGGRRGGQPPCRARSRTHRASYRVVRPPASTRQRSTRRSPSTRPRRDR